jgi:hypothetical protein
MNKKTRIYFGPPLARLTESESNTMEISSRINRTAERYLEILTRHGLELTEAETECLRGICAAGVLAPHEILELSMEVELGKEVIPGLDRAALIEKLDAASFADLVAVVESLGY